MDVEIRITSGDRADELAALWRWLQEEDELQGDVSPMETRISEGELGGAFDLITVVLGSGGAGFALTRSLNTWLRTRHSDVKVTVSAGERSVELEATNVKDAVPMLQEVLRDFDRP
ncbi:hypothetical protein OHT76_43315 [Streptomyces sp. NBC_00287]|uniref:effector-associated constant component EACC1 n=1 Tax=Streptomyces sp. NBC_00287 TaxID=2975702 RepID=UPI002E28E334|nr:hypothetical protein [Streptomyces sp. NBC_00287]